jgi:ABC-type nitrate/sulfonate/bicarbonate transport system substrate-binding protein
MGTRRSSPVDHCRRPLAMVLLLAVLALTLAQSGRPPAAAAADPRVVKVTTLGLCNEVYLWWGQDKGIFEKHGLKVETVRTAGGAAGVAAIISGSADFSFTNGYTAIISYSQNFPVRFIAGGYETPLPPKPEPNGVIVKADSPYREAKDLVGKRIGVNELGGVNQIVVSAWLRKNGIDPKSVKFVALPFPELVPAVLQGRLDATQVPLQSIARQPAGTVRSLGDPYRLGVGKIVFAGYLTTKDFLDRNQPVVEAFQRALAESVKQVKDPANAQAQFAVAAKHCNQDAALLARMPQQEYEAFLDFETLKKMAETLVVEGQLQAAPNLEPFVPAFARKR